MRACLLALVASLFPWDALLSAAEPLPPLPSQAKLVLEEDWSSGSIDEKKWYVYRKRWGNGNHGVVPENVTVKTDVVSGQKKNVLVCTAHGDQYDGDVIGWWGNKTRVGGVIVSHQHFASGRFEMVVKVGDQTPHEGGPKDPTQPKGCIPALWTIAIAGSREIRTARTIFKPRRRCTTPTFQLMAWPRMSIGRS